MLSVTKLSPWQGIQRAQRLGAALDVTDGNDMFNRAPMHLAAGEGQPYF